MFSLVVAISSSGIEESSPSYNLSSAYGYNSTKAMALTRFNMLFFSYEHISGSSPLQSAISCVCFLWHSATECCLSDNSTKANAALITRFNMLFFRTSTYLAT
uniref:Uncharacterized protein n=1 Tax=Acrobeloides nanus TaxID=290746 RepID=A0A914EPQ8_9BILA